MSSVPCLVIAGTHSGVGKTSVATALMSLYTRRGLKVQAFKVGPDFIDLGFHHVATGRASHNLDGWMLSRETNLNLFARAAADADLCIVEGVMGLFDGQSAQNETGSTAEMAKWLGAPVLLVADGSAMARSAAAIVHGYESFDPDLEIAGAIFNRVSSDKHYAYLQPGVTANCKAKPLGYLPKEAALALPERHLGLQLATEVVTPALLGRLADWVEGTVDTEAILHIARSVAVPLIPIEDCKTAPVARIAIARDLAFQFYYEENLSQLRFCGTELVEFSPIHDAALPDDIGGVYLGGGYPELHATALAQNGSMLASIRDFASTGGPIYAECGGFMYLTEAIVDGSGETHEMCGIFPTRARMQPRLAALGYAEIEVSDTSGWLADNQRVLGHEFRYSVMDEMPPDIRRVFTVRTSRGIREEGFLTGGVLGSYFHLHFASCPQFTRQFVTAAQKQLIGSLS